MSIDLGPQGLLLLVAPALLFGAIAQALTWRTASHWIWLGGAIGWFLGGLFMSEFVFGAETTEENLQPLIDGLLLDESLLGGLIGGLAVVGVMWFATRHPSHHGTLAH